MRKFIILGSCGSIGTQTLDILNKVKSKFKIEAISVGRDLHLASKIIEKYKPNLVCTRKKEDIDVLSKKFNCQFTFGDQGLIEVATYKKDEDILLISALVGSVGLLPTIEAIKVNRNIALANKETLVMAGDIVMKMAREYKVNILPLDSEHSAIWQCMRGEEYSQIKRLIITASGGSLRDLTLDELDNVTIEDVLNHPNWSMGSKITVDSATMMNKGFEVIEAHHLFNIPYSKIETLLHKESIIHSMVEFEDGQLKAQLGPHDMRLPIIYAINYPNREKTNVQTLDFTKVTNLSFKELCQKRYNCLKLSYECGNKGNIFPVVLNASNEVCVNLFLDGKIKFTDIDKIIEKTLLEYDYIDDLNIDKIIQIDKEVKEKIYQQYGDVK